MQWNLVFIRVTIISNTISTKKPSSLGHEVQELEKCDIILSEFIGFYPKVNQVIYFSAQNTIPNIKALPHMFFEISCTHSYVSTFEKGRSATITYRPEKKTDMGQLFFHKQLIYEI